MRLTPELERTLRRYVRGDVDEPLRLELEELLLTDPDVFEALGMVEDEMAEEYLEGDFSPLERKGFEAHFLSCPEHRARLRLLQAIKDRAAAGSAPTVGEAPVAATGRVSQCKPSWVETVAGWIRPLRWQPAWMAVSAALVLSLAANVWLLSRSLAGGRATTSAQATLTLSPGLLRAEGTLPRVSVPSAAASVRLSVELPGDDYPYYRATLVDDEGQEVWVAARLKAATSLRRTFVVLVVPASLLPRGDYQLRVGGIPPAGDPEDLSSSPFRVNTP